MKSILTHIQTVPWLKPLRNAGWLGLGRGAQAVFSIGTLAFSARALGVELFGVLVLIHSLALMVSQLCRFQSWQAVAKYGAEALEAKDNKRLSELLKFSFRLDAIGFVMAVMFMAAAGHVMASWLNVPDEYKTLAQIYGVCAVIFMNIGYTALGVMRLFDRFSKLALQNTIEPAIRFLGAGLLFSTAGSLASFLILWLSALVVGKLFLFWQAITALKQEQLWAEIKAGRPVSTVQKWAPEKNIWRFVIATHLISTLRMVPTHIPLLLVGGILGPAAAGLFRVAKQFADLLIKPNRKLLEPALLPELSKLSAAASYKQRQLMVRRMSGLIGFVALLIFGVLAVFGEALISAIAGAAYLDAYAPMIWLALGGVVGLAMSPFEPLLMAAGKTMSVLMANVLAAICFIVFMFVMLPAYGVMGAGMAMAIYNMLLGLFVFLPAQHLIRADARKGQDAETFQSALDDQLTDKTK